MKIFPDTSFICALYRNQCNSKQADDFMKEVEPPMQVSSLLLLEFRQSVRLQIRLHKNDRNKGFSEKEGFQMLRNLQSDLASGLLAVVPIDWADVHFRAEMMSSKHTINEGHRLADILHVATAVHLSSEIFLTFDVNQKKLAESEGIIVPF